MRDIEEAYIVRAELEALAAATAATRITPAQLARLRASEERFREVSDEMRRSTRGNGRGPMAAWSRANDAFHTVIQRAAGNQRLQETVTRAAPHLPAQPHQPAARRPTATCSTPTAPSTGRSGWRSSRGDPDASRDAMRRHILHSGELVAAWYAERSE